MARGTGAARPSGLGPEADERTDDEFFTELEPRREEVEQGSVQPIPLSEVRLEERVLGHDLRWACCSRLSTSAHCGWPAACAFGSYST